MRKETIKKIVSSSIYFLITCSILQAALYLVPESYYIKNSGFLFGYVDSNLLASLVLVVGAVSTFWLAIVLNYPTYHYSLIFLAAGLTSNLIDRTFRGGVIDYFLFGNFPAFNFADVCIVTSLALMAFLFLKQKNAL